MILLIVRSVDGREFLARVKGTNPWLIGLGLAHAPVLIVLAAARWRLLLGAYSGCTVPFGFSLREYWIGVALGFFSPASLGLDAYRIIVGSRRFGGYGCNTAVVVVEKALALVTCMGIIAALYPLVPMNLDTPMRKVFYLAYALLGLTLILITGLLLLARGRRFRASRKRMEEYMTGKLSSVLNRFVAGEGAGIRPVSLEWMVAPLYDPRVVWVAAFSFGIQLVSSLKSQIFFCAMGHDIPLIVNLFVAPAMYFIFLLPISLGSIGIREGVYIVLYGYFGVPMEVALWLSFFNFSGMILNNLIGGFIMLGGGALTAEKRNSTAETSPQCK